MTTETAERPEVAYFTGMGYSDVRQLPDGSWAGITRLMFTYAILSGLNAWGYEDRWCFEREADARAALAAWDGEGDPGDKWHRNPTTGRRRNKDGTVYVEW